MQLIQQYLPFLAIFAPIVLFWNQFKSILSRIVFFFFKQREICQELAIPLYKVLSKYPKYNFNDYDINLKTAFNKTSDKSEIVIQKTSFNEIIFYKRFIPIFISRISGSWSGEDKYKFSYFSGTFPFEKLLSRIAKSIAAYQEHHFSVGKIFGKKTNSLSDNSGSRLFANATTSSTAGGSKNNSKVKLFPTSTSDWFNNHLGSLIGNDISNFSALKPINSKNKYVYTKSGLYIKDIVTKWLNSELWYDEHDLRYYHGIALYSPPGAGKSSLIIRVAKDLDLPVRILDISSFTNKDLSDIIPLVTGSKTILLIEDIDCVFDGRENIHKDPLNQSISFDALLNFLSGAENLRNVFVFITTNNLDKLDKALIRPGRCDELIEFPNLNIDEKQKVASIIVGPEYASQLALEGEHDSTAEFENRCVSFALTKYWHPNE